MRENGVVFFGNLDPWQKYYTASGSDKSHLWSDYQKQVSRVIWLGDESQQSIPCFTSFENEFYLDNLRAQS